MTETPAYAALKAHKLRIYRLEHLQALATWDRMTYMPRGSAAARAEAQGELAALVQSLQAAPELGELLDRAAAEPLGGEDRANLALMQRERLLAAAVPEALVARRIEAIAAGSAGWAEARAANAWGPFAAPLQALVAVVREIADRTGDALGLSRYDALLDGFDRGLRRSTVDGWFGDIASWLPGLARTIIERQAGEAVVAPQGRFAMENQRAACIAAMEALGFDFERGRLDVSVHPFTGGAPEDVRLTTRFSQEDALSSILGIIHETGHGRYQAGLPAEWRGQPLGEPCSASMHEAQALSFERQLARTRGFAAVLSPILRQHLGHDPAFEESNLHRLMSRVKASPIRVDADEVTYPAHVILRTQIEAALIDGEIGVEDIPAAWDEQMQALLGVDVRGNLVEGPLQDIHWSQGMFGYFPAYLIGAMIAAQLFEAMVRGGITDRDASGPGAPRAIAEWLSQNVWRRGALLTTEELVREITGAPLSPAALRAHFKRRYGTGA